MGPGLTFGFPRMHAEAGERRDFLPSTTDLLAELGCDVYVEDGIGSGMGYTADDYVERWPERVHVVDAAVAYRQDVVVVLRAPNERLRYLRPGATLISMLHFPTRPARVRRLVDLGVEAISLDTIEDDDGRRLVVNAAAVAWNGLEAAFRALARTWPALVHADRRPVRVTIMGAGHIGKHAVEAATKYGDVAWAARLRRAGVPGVEVTTIGRDLTGDGDYVRARLAVTDLLVDATQRDDASVPIVPNAWLAAMPRHAVICDLVVDPYLLDAVPPTVRGIEGIPQGDLDRYVLGPEDPAWDRVPASIPTANRRVVVSCYSWPGVHPRRCMELYGKQLEPALRTFVRRGGVHGLRADGSFYERALRRGSLRAWLERVLAEPEVIGA